MVEERGRLKISQYLAPAKRSSSAQKAMRAICDFYSPTADLSWLTIALANRTGTIVALTTPPVMAGHRQGLCGLSSVGKKGKQGVQLASGMVDGSLGKWDNLGQPPILNLQSSRKFHEVAGDNVCPSQVRGLDYLRDPRLNKGMAFTLEERQRLGIHGLLPPRFKTQEEQVELCKRNLNRYQEDLNKYVYLAGLQDRNERLFYRLLSENVEEMMPIVYTPTVGLACQKFGVIYRRPRGLFITINDRGHVYDILRNWSLSQLSLYLA
ncbi:unnamed protein product [Darwinula stevensoni]|uniref:Malic enzyme N-terminal domain-containing protein n=1 Tax=Darwinula stevensoni TaxID=69355 RepID=A0A7R9A0W6_9CRUS|nr:unnamed protein product [Darwinula stevensoni]CAG0886470.1 unnamed protein product [Darwinula stevensoni]